jgi:hypothetical protein
MEVHDKEEARTKIEHNDGRKILWDPRIVEFGRHSYKVHESGYIFNLGFSLDLFEFRPESRYSWKYFSNIFLGSSCIFVYNANTSGSTSYDSIGWF